MKTNFRDLYLIGISFVAGVLFIVQCGGTAKSIADAVADALDINYSNTDSGLSATTVQAAIDELESAIPFVFDASGNRIGTYVSDPGGGWWEMWDIANQVLFWVEPVSGEVIAYSESDDDVTENRVFYSTTDCSGTPYLSVGGSGTGHPQLVDDILYTHVFGGDVLSEDGVQSAENFDGSCTSLNLSALRMAVSSEPDIAPTYIEATEMTEPNYEGPLFKR